VQNAVIKAIWLKFGLDGATKKRLVRFIGNNENWGKRMVLVPAEACADCRDLTQAKHH
jgi:hypothetical protein